MKGKKYKKYGFNSKVSITVTKTHSIIVATKFFVRNPYGNDTLDDTIQ